MISLQIKNIKQFMNQFLAGDAFDSFLLEQASISTYNTFTIDGRENRAFYTSEEWEDGETRPYEFTQWKKIRPVCFDLIKGKRTPTAFHFVLHLLPEYTASLLEKGDTTVTPDQVKAFVLNIKYDGTSLTLITGTAFHTFLMDKTPDMLWDRAVIPTLPPAPLIIMQGKLRRRHHHSEQEHHDHHQNRRKIIYKLAFFRIAFMILHQNLHAQQDKNHGPELENQLIVQRREHDM